MIGTYTLGAVKLTDKITQQTDDTLYCITDERLTGPLNWTIEVSRGEATTNALKWAILTGYYLEGTQ